MLSSYKQIIILLLIFTPLPSFLFSQMPDWTLIIDKDGNRYYIDKNSKIWTSGIPEFNYKAVSVDGLDFYINHGLELIRSHYKEHALTLLKSIKAMPPRNNRIYEAQCKATEMINYLIKNEGDRFSEINTSSSILLYRDKENTVLINDKIGYSIEIPNIFNIIHKRIRGKSRNFFYGILLGINLRDKDVSIKQGYRGYDLLLAINSEISFG